MTEELQATEELIEAEPVRPLPVRAEGRRDRDLGARVRTARRRGRRRSGGRGCGGAGRRPSGPFAEAPSPPGALPPPREGRRQSQLPGRRSRPRALTAHASSRSACCPGGPTGCLGAAEVTAWCAPASGVARAPASRRRSPRQGPWLANPRGPRPRPCRVGRPVLGRPSDRRRPAIARRIGCPGRRSRARHRGRADAFLARGRGRHGGVLPDLQARPAARAGDPSQALGEAETPALALGGALLGDHRPADRELPRRRDPAAHRPPVGAEPPATRPCSAAVVGATRGRCATFPRPP